MIGISHIPCCYRNLVAMATRVQPNNSFVVLSSYLVWRLLGTIGISHIPRCYGNSVAKATEVKRQ